jgi:threonine synthase
VPFAVAGVPVLAKCEFCLPTGSYKDRGAAVLIRWLQAAGVTAALEDSSGNAGAALAAAAARAGVALTVFCPASAPAGKRAQIRAYGARLVAVEGPRARATEALLAHAGQTGAAYASHLWHPLFLHGVKTMAFELWEQLGGAAPATVVCPTGAGSILLGLHLGFTELLAAGLIRSLPRLVAVQAERIQPICQAWRAGHASVAPAAPTEPTLADGIALPGPVRGSEVITALRDSDGMAVAVSEEEIAAGVRHLGRAGLCVEPTSAVVWPALRRLHQAGQLPADGAVVAILSGHGLKAVPVLTSLLEPTEANAGP